MWRVGVPYRLHGAWGIYDYYHHKNNKHKNYKGVIYGNNVVASPYITNLLLFRGRKFHLRMYYMISCINGIINTFFLDNGDIMTAKNNFNMDNFMIYFY